MKISRYEALNPEKIAEVYKLRQVGAGWTEMVDKTGVKNPTQCITAINRILNRGATSRSSARYVSAIKILKDEGYIKDHQGKVETNIVNHTEDIYGRLNKSFSNFMGEIDAFITYQVDKRAGELKAKNEQLKKELEEYERKYKAELEVAKNGNWVNNLKSKWQ